MSFTLKESSLDLWNWLVNVMNTIACQCETSPLKLYVVSPPCFVPLLRIVGDECRERLRSISSQQGPCQGFEMVEYTFAHPTIDVWTTLEANLKQRVLRIMAQGSMILSSTRIWALACRSERRHTWGVHWGQTTTHYIKEGLSNAKPAKTHKEHPRPHLVYKPTPLQ